MMRRSILLLAFLAAASVPGEAQAQNNPSPNWCGDNGWWPFAECVLNQLSFGKVCDMAWTWNGGYGAKCAWRSFTPPFEPPSCQGTPLNSYPFLMCVKGYLDSGYNCTAVGTEPGHPFPALRAYCSRPGLP